MCVYMCVQNSLIHKFLFKISFEPCDFFMMYYWIEDKSYFITES